MVSRISSAQESTEPRDVLDAQNTLSLNYRTSAKMTLLYISTMVLVDTLAYKRLMLTLLPTTAYVSNTRGAIDYWFQLKILKCSRVTVHPTPQRLSINLEALRGKPEKLKPSKEYAKLQESLLKLPLKDRYANYHP